MFVHYSETISIFYLLFGNKNKSKQTYMNYFVFVFCFGGPIRRSDGYYMFDDMLLDENQIKLFDGTDRSGATNAIRWPNGVIPYKYSSQIPSKDRKAIKGSLHIFNEEFKGCLRTRYYCFSFYLAWPFRNNEMKSL